MMYQHQALLSASLFSLIFFTASFGNHQDGAKQLLIGTRETYVFTNPCVLEYHDKMLLLVFFYRDIGNIGLKMCSMIICADKMAGIKTASKSRQ